MLTIWGEGPDLFLKATTAYLKRHSLAANLLLKTAVRSLCKACGIHRTDFGTDECLEPTCLEFIMLRDVNLEDSRSEAVS